MFAWLKKAWSRIRAWLFQSQPPIPKAREVEGPPAVVLDTRAREQMQPIGLDAWIENGGDTWVVLEGSLIEKLAVPPHGSVKIPSPVFEVVGTYGAVRAFKMREWDALFVAVNMLTEYARGSAYDVMTPDELKVCTFPFPDRALGAILERTKLKAHR